jgi:transcription initiation factor TFIID subunit 5
MSNTPSVNNNNSQGSINDQEQQQQISNAEAAAAAAAAATSTSAAHTPADIDKMVASYLQKKGYKATEAIFSRESKGETVSVDDVSAPEASAATEKQLEISTIDETDQVMDEVTESAASGNPDVYDVSYKSLREWIENSLDWYKVTIYISSILFLGY